MTDARIAMVDAAERIVAERGLAAMTLREVQTAAGQRNKSAPQYHFGSRSGLVEAIIEERMAPVNVRRLEMLAELDATARPQSVRDLIDVLVRPLAIETLTRPGSHYARFLVQATFDPTLQAAIDRHLRIESFYIVRTRLIEASRLSKVDAERRVNSMVMLVLVTLAALEGGRRTRERTVDLIADLIETCVSVIDAPLPKSAPFPSLSTVQGD